MRSHQDSLRQAFTACLRFTACEFIFASRPLRFTTYHLVPLFACLYVAGAGGASCTTRRRARAARVAGARDAVGVRGGTFRLRFLAVRSCIGSSVVGSVCVFLSARLRRRVAPLCSYRCLFVGLVVARAWCVINRQRRESIALLFLLVLSLTAWLSPRHPVQRRPAIVLVPFGTSPDHGALIFLFVKERAADCARCPLRIRI